MDCWTGKWHQQRGRGFCRTSHSLAVKADGTVWAWGYNAYGQLGDGTTTQRNTPVQVSGLTNVVAVEAGTITRLR